MVYDAVQLDARLAADLGAFEDTVTFTIAGSVNIHVTVAGAVVGGEAVSLPNHPSYCFFKVPGF